MTDAVPSWVRALCRHDFFSACAGQHDRASSRPPVHNLFCVDCELQVCPECADSEHEGHRILKVRRIIALPSSPSSRLPRRVTACLTFAHLRHRRYAERPCKTRSSWRRSASARTSTSAIFRCALALPRSFAMRRAGAAVRPAATLPKSNNVRRLAACFSHPRLFFPVTHRSPAVPLAACDHQQQRHPVPRSPPLVDARARGGERLRGLQDTVRMSFPPPFPPRRRRRRRRSEKTAHRPPSPSPQEELVAREVRFPWSPLP